MVIEDNYLNTNLVVLFDHAFFTYVDSTGETELIGHLPFRTFT